MKFFECVCFNVVCQCHSSKNPLHLRPDLNRLLREVTKSPAIGTLRKWIQSISTPAVTQRCATLGWVDFFHRPNPVTVGRLTTTKWWWWFFPRESTQHVQNNSGFRTYINETTDDWVHVWLAVFTAFCSGRHLAVGTFTSIIICQHILTLARSPFYPFTQTSHGSSIGQLCVNSNLPNVMNEKLLILYGLNVCRCFNILIATSFSSFEKKKRSILWLRICPNRSKSPPSAALSGPDWSSGIYFVKIREAN